MFEKLNFRPSKMTLLEFGLKIILSQSIKHNLKMAFILLLNLIVDQDIINEYMYKFIQ